MRSRRPLLRILGSCGLAASLLLGLSSVWPSPRESVEVSIGPTALTATEGPAAATPQPGSITLPGFTVHLDLPRHLLSGRTERLALRLDAPPPDDAFVLSAEIVSADLRVDPPGESGQALRPGAAFAWSVTAGGGPDAAATFVLRIRPAAVDGRLPQARLLLARDLRLPVRTAFGLPWPWAGWVAGLLAAAGAAALSAGVRMSTHGEKK